MELPKAGIILIDKPQGWTSHDVVAKVRRLTGVKRVGHAGTLDPLATGLLIVLVTREFTKRQDEFMKQEKEYVTTGQLGWVTDSYDADGETVSRLPAAELTITQTDLEQVLPQFTGQITQQVPAFSAVKVGGKKLYQKARQQQLTTEELPSRQVEIKELEVLEFDPDQMRFTLRVVCSSGTYIRSLVHDIGQVLQVGATVTQLRRTRIGDFSVANALTITDFA